MSTALLIAAVVFAGFFTIFSMRIVHELSKRGVKINIVLLRLYLIKYISQYKQITREETGRVGPLYYPCVGSIILALVLAAAGLLLKFR
jgi:type III secretory pathway component EscU